MNKSLLGIFGLIFCIGIVGLVYSAFPTTSNLSLNLIGPSEGGPRYHSNVCIQKNSEPAQCSHNVLTNAGKSLINDVLTGTKQTEVKYIALCNLTNVSADTGGNACVQPAAANTLMLGEYKLCGLARAAGTLTVPTTSDGNFSYSKTFIATCDNLQTNVTAIFNSTQGSGDAYFAGNNFTAVTLQTNDQLTVTWYIWVT